MLFFEGIFLVFLVVTLVASAGAFGSVRARTLILLVASYVFYAAWDWRFLFLIFGSTAVDFVLASKMPSATPRGRRRLLVASLVANLGTLAVFKYLDFGVESLDALFGLGLGVFEVTLPVGISFFTFQSMSYTIDVYRGHIEPDPDFAEFALFVSFFPQLVAGPIIRAEDFLPQVRSALARPLHRVRQAVPLFVSGLFKKVVVADHMASVVDLVYADPAAFSSADRWLATLAFAVQIYCDFSGYTDMALALCMLFGFEFPANFRSPYLSRGPREFWRRWHISLSTWLRDYLYIPLGGSKSGLRRTYIALVATMTLGGLWHGAAWTFVLWGLFHGGLLVAERALFPGRTAEILPSWVRWPVFFVLTLIGWMIFRAESWSGLVHLVDGLWRVQAPLAVAPWVVVAGSVYVAIEHVVTEWEHAGGWLRERPTLRFALAGLLLPLCFLLRPPESGEFIYFQF